MIENILLWCCAFQNLTWYQIIWGSSLASKIDFQVLFAGAYNSFMDLISHEVVQNEEEEVDRDSTNDSTQVSSSMASSLCQEAIFHEDNIQVVSINNVEYLSLHSTFFSSMSSITNDEDGLLVGDHSEPSLEYGFSSHESIGSKDGQGEVWNSSEDISLLQSSNSFASYVFLHHD